VAEVSDEGGSPARRVGGEAAALARLAAPIIGGQLALMGLNFIDTVMAGRLGAAPLAAVAVGSSVWSSVNLFLLGTMLAVPALVSELDGAGRRRRVAPLLTQALWVGLGLATVATLLVANLRPLLELLRVQPEIVPVTEEYLRALCWGIPAWVVYLAVRFTSEGLGETRPVLYLGLFGLPLNVLANWMLMYGALGLPRLGARGCGYATAIVWTAQAVGMVLWVTRRREYRGLHLLARFDRPRPARIARILRLGLPIAVSLFVEGSIFTAVALVLSTMGTEVVAGHQVALNFSAITFMLPLGVSMAVTVRVGGAFGRRDAAALRFAAGVGIAMAMACQLVSASVMLWAPGAVAGLYSRDPQVVAVAVELLFFAALFQLSDGLQVSAAGALRGIQDTRVPMLIVLVAYWLFGLPLGGLLTARGAGAAGMWIGLIAGLTAAAVLLVLRFRRVSRRLARHFAGPGAARPPGTGGGRYSAT
jgi:MATE family multidrug resistance protein